MIIMGFRKYPFLNHNKYKSKNLTNKCNKIHMFFVLLLIMNLLTKTNKL